jgi:hypothetical protein
MEASEQIPERVEGDLWNSMNYYARLQQAIPSNVYLSDKKVVDQLYSALY